MAYTLSFDSNVRDIAHLLNHKQEQVLLILYNGDSSYAAEMIDIIGEKSCGSKSIKWLDQIYDILDTLVKLELIFVAQCLPGEKNRRHHRSKHYRITELGKEVVNCLDEYRFSLQQKR